MKRDICDIAAEIGGISALSSYLSMDFLERSNRADDVIVGECLFAISRYAERISEELEDITSEEFLKRRQKETA